MGRFTPILVVVLTLTLTAAAMACPMCKDSVPSSDAQSAGALPGGFNNSIYIMLSGLFCVIGMVALTLVKATRSSGAARTGRGFPVR